MKPPVKKYNGYVYIVKIWLDNVVLYKVGTTNRLTVMVRILEIAKELHDILGYIPKMKVIRDKRTRDNYNIEAEVLRNTAGYRYSMKCEKAICGESELRKMDESLLLIEYEKAIAKGYPIKEPFKIGM